MTIRENLVVRTPAFLSLFYFVVDVIVGPVIFAPAVLTVKKCFWQPTKFRQQISTSFNRSENHGKPFLILFSLYFVSASGLSLSRFVFPFSLLLALYLYKLCDVFRYIHVFVIKLTSR